MRRKAGRLDRLAGQARADGRATRAIWGAGLPAFRQAPADEAPQHRQAREGGSLAEVPVAFVENDTAWSPTLTLDDCRKLDEVRLALRRRDIAAAARNARLFALTPAA